MYNRQRLIHFLSLVLILLFSACSKTNSPSQKNIVWGGTVSHHSLADEYIDDFFSEIQKQRNVKTFILICPSHFGLSTYNYSVADCYWELPNGQKVLTDLPKAKKVCSSFQVDFDRQVFGAEHGASALMPFINKYFPEAKVVAIAIDGEPPMNIDYAEKLYQTIEPFFRGNNKKDNFLLISTDFAHHGNVEQTKKKDERSLIFFNNLKHENWLFCGCDNRPGIYVLSKFLTDNSTVNYLRHTDSFEISGEGEDDITSYYFSLISN